MADLFNLSFITGVFLSVLITAKVVPVFKKDSKLNYSNYRPISFLSNIEKILGKLMYKRLYTFLDYNNIICDSQFQFRQQYSTYHALINTENIRKALDDRSIGCGVFVDLQKAFDTVDHQILLAKVNCFGIHGASNDWLKSYKNCLENILFVSKPLNNLSPSIFNTWFSFSSNQHHPKFYVG